jgi:hypothetical protein
MSSKSIGDSINQAVERIFDTYEDVSYIAAVNSKLKVLAHKGFLELHPSKIHVLHVQAALLVGMSTVWSESLGRLDYTSALFNSKSEIVVFPISPDVHVLAVLTPTSKKDMDAVKREILHEFKND